MAQKQVEKLNHTVVDLATQLDEALRERETQRLEVTRLRKQLQQLQLAGRSCWRGSLILFAVLTSFFLLVFKF